MGASRAVKLATVCAVTFLIVYFTLSLLGRTSETSLPVASSLSREIQRTFPQRWAFFTRNPQSPTVRLFRREHGEWTEVPINPGLSFDNWFGFRRTRRVVGSEMAMIAADLLPFEWHRCEDLSRECLDAPPTTAAAETRIRNVLDTCGQHAIVNMKPTPWAWRTLGKISKDAKFAKFEISCK